MTEQAEKTAKPTRLTGYKEAVAYTDKMGCGRCTERPTTIEDGQQVPVMRKASDDKDQPVMYLRLSHADPKRLREVLASFMTSGYKVATQDEPALDDTEFIGKMPGDYAAFYIDVQFEFEEGEAGTKPRIVLLRR